MKPILEIIRLEETQAGTFGVLKINKEVFCVTLEPPDRLNLTNKSCIPAQQYICNQVETKNFGATFQISNVPGRAGILFHKGNFVHSTSGCVLLAQYFGKIKGDRAVLNSGKTFKKFMMCVGNHQQLHLTIKEVF